MATIPTQTQDFQPGNRWNINDGLQQMDFTMRSLVHAAVTAGHAQGWRQSVLSITGGRAELLMRAAALQSAVYEGNIQRRGLQTPIARLFPTDRFNMMDDSEKRGLTYHLGITLAVAWARKALRIPWLLHINVYEQQLNINLQPGRSRPDLVGMHSDGSWVVFESKGRSSPPSSAAESKAKKQSQRIVDIGGVVPASCFALFAFFYRDFDAIGYPKPKVVHLRIKDPDPEGDMEPIHLPELTIDKLFDWYYQPWIQMLSKAKPIASPQGTGDSLPTGGTPSRPDLFSWYDVIDLDFRVGIISELAIALEQRRYPDVPNIIQDISRREGLLQMYPDWAGDGLVVEPGESWKKIWYEK